MMWRPQTFTDFSKFKLAGLALELFQDIEGLENNLNMVFFSIIMFLLRWIIENFFGWCKQHLNVYHVVVGSAFGLMA